MSGLVRSRTAFAGDIPVRLDEAFYPHALVEGTPIATEVKVPGGIYATLAKAGHVPAAVARRTVGARAATEEEAKQLKLAAGACVLTADLAPSRTDTAGWWSCCGSAPTPSASSIMFHPYFLV